MNDEDVRIGWIGLGRMGTEMVTRLINAGNEVSIYNRTSAKTKPLVMLGAKSVASTAELAECNIVFVMVSADQDVLDVTIGANGVLKDSASAPQILIDCSTITAETSAVVREAALARGTKFLAAPVSGNPKVVAAGLLTLAVSGDRSAFDEALPYMSQIGHGVTYVGEDEVARLVKICHNLFLGAMAQSLAEILVLAECGGIKRSALLEFINHSILGSPFTRYKTPAFVNLDFTPTFTAFLLRKDFELGVNAAKAAGVSMPVASLCTQMVASAVDAGFGNSDFAVLLAEQARSSGLSMTPENVEVSDGLDIDQ